MKKIFTVGDLREALKHYEDEESLEFVLDQPQIMAPNKRIYMECGGVQSSAGGRAGIMWFDPRPIRN